MTNHVYIVTQTDFDYEDEEGFEGSESIVGVYSTWEVAAKAAKWYAKEAAEDMWDEIDREQVKDGWTVWQRDGDRDHSDIRIKKHPVYDDFSDYPDDEDDNSEQEDDAQDEGTQDEDEDSDEDELAQPPPAKRQKVEG